MVVDRHFRDTVARLGIPSDCRLSAGALEAVGGAWRLLWRFSRLVSLWRAVCAPVDADAFAVVDQHAVSWLDLDVVARQTIHRPSLVGPYADIAVSLDPYNLGKRRAK